MNKSLLAFSSFILGVGCTVFVITLPKTIAGQASVIAIPNAIPQVRPIQFFGDGNNINGPLQQLDGLQCNRCIITVPLLTYQGGAVDLSHCKLSPKSVIELKGAALNTFNVLRSLRYINPQTQTATLDIKSPDAFTLRAIDGIVK